MRKLIQINIAATLLLAGLFFGINKLFATPLGQCPENDYVYDFIVHLPDTKDPTIYYKCENGEPVKKECHAGTVFCPWLYVCVPPSETTNGAGGGVAHTTPVMCWFGGIGIGAYQVECIGEEGWCVPQNPC